MLYLWRIQYWTAFILCWFVFPMVGEWVRGGAFTFKRKLYLCAWGNIQFYIFVGVFAGIALLIMMLFFPEVKG